MVLVNSLSDLKLRKMKWMVYVKILNIWNQPPKYEDEITTMILVDEKGKRMDAIIPNRAYNDKFRTRIREGKWYLLSNFKVVLPTRILRYSKHPYEIEFTCKTSIDRVSSRSRWNFFNDYDFTMINSAKAEDKDFVVDAIGVIHSVEPVGILSWVPRRGECDFESRYITFTIKDTLGKFMKCVVLGKACEDFLLQWEKRISRVEYSYEKIIASLRFWRISEYEGKPCLLTEVGCSKTFIDPNYPDFDNDHYISAFSICEEDELNEEVVEANF